MATIEVPLDSYVDSANPSTPFVAAPKLRIEGGARTAYAYVTVKPPVTGPDVLYTSAVLQHRAASSGVACTLTAKQVTSKKGYGNLTYNAQPTNTATGAVATVLGATVAGDLIEQTITAFVQAWATGAAANYGLRLDAGATAVRKVWSAQATDPTMRPKLVYTVYRKPTTPQVVGPSGNQQVSIARPKLTWVPPSDPLMKQTHYQVQMNATDSWGAPTYDSDTATPGGVPSTAGEHLVTFDINNATTWYWRFRVKNGGGQWSDWSAGQQFGRTNKPTFTISQPTGGAWTDSTPPTIWSALSAGTQKQYQVQHIVGGVVKIDSGILPGADTSWTYSLPIPNFASGTVTTRVRLWDSVNRAATPGDEPSVVVDATWTYTPGATVAATALVAAANATLPAVDLTWSRASTPDRWDIQRRTDGGDWTSVGVFEGPDLSTGGTGYAWTDPTAPPHHELEYRVVAGVNGVDAAASPTDTIELTDVDHIWLLDPEDDTFWVALADKAANGMAYTEDSESVYVKGSDRAVVTFDSLRGFEGQVAGGVYGTPTSKHLGRTAQEMRDAIIVHCKTYPTRILRLVVADYNIPIVVRDLTPILRPEEELSYGLQFTASQQGELPWL